VSYIVLLLPVAITLTHLPALAQASLPDPNMTSSAINLAVTQTNIQATICARGWTRTVRPPEGPTYKLKRRQIRECGYRP
jgi:hypothetical protein